MKFKLVNIGRDKVNRVVEVDDINDLRDEVKKHLFSSKIQIHTDDCIDFKVYAGLRNVGRIEKIES